MESPVSVKLVSVIVVEEKTRSFAVVTLVVVER